MRGTRQGEKGGVRLPAMEYDVVYNIVDGTMSQDIQHFMFDIICDITVICIVYDIVSDVKHNTLYTMKHMISCT